MIHNMQSIKFANDKVDFVINAWDMEKDWISHNGFMDYDFFLYKVFTQMHSLMGLSLIHISSTARISGK